MNKTGKVSTSLMLGVMVLALAGAVLIGSNGETGSLFTGDSVEISFSGGGFLGVVFAVIAFMLLMVLGYAVLVYDSNHPIKGLAEIDESIAEIQRKLERMR